MSDGLKCNCSNRFHPASRCDEGTRAWPTLGGVVQWGPALLTHRIHLPPQTRMTGGLMLRMGQDSCALVQGSSDALSRLRARLHRKHDSRRNRGMPVAAGAPCVRGRRPGAEPCGHNSPAHLYKPHTEPSQSEHAHSGSGMSCCIFAAYDTPMLLPSLVQVEADKTGGLPLCASLARSMPVTPTCPPLTAPCSALLPSPFPSTHAPCFSSARTTSCCT